jgi:hypothetical protein
MENIRKSILAITILTAYLYCSCRQSDNSAANPQNALFSKELAQINTQVDSLGPIIFTIDFTQKASGKDLKVFQDGFIPWISIENPKPEIKNLVDADKIVLPFKKAKIIIDYPLNVPASFYIATTGQGFTRKQLITEISEKYHIIYKLEESTATTKTVPLDKRKGLINRNQTDGKFGVWGHDLSDLDLSEIEVHKNSQGQITLTLAVES